MIPFHLRVILALLILVAPLGAQRLELRAGGVSRDTLYLLPNDTIPLQVTGKTSAGGTVIPRSIEYWQTAHCVAVTDDGTARAHLVELGCGLVPGWLRVTATVAGQIVEDSAFVARPTPDVGSNLGLCLAWQPASLFYSARDTVIALAIHGADRRIAANFLPDSVAPQWNWQGARLQVQYAAIACMPGYATKDITRLTATRWTTANPAVAMIDRYGLATWLTRRAPMVVSAEWPVK